ncbi:uncharacterized protein [Drosophila pseudoobscura]|uniref:Uncharacterized protein isoform X1 n=1 Tax=Drosophila pseudoobscura pseudoobscura TaxID=46245 RepID=A0A6I8V2G0_DROPS|nr:uncharacterized protein LOC6897208 isoform X1 [Drosophila pseudoobscura]
MNSDPSVGNDLTEFCKSSPEIRKTMDEFEAALEKSTDINKKMSQHYKPLIWCADSAIGPEDRPRVETLSEDKKKSAKDVRHTLIKSIVFASKSFDYLQAKLKVPQVESIEMNPPGALSAIDVLEALGVLPNERHREQNNFTGFPDSLPTVEKGSTLEDPMVLDKPDSA